MRILTSILWIVFSVELLARCSSPQYQTGLTFEDSDELFFQNISIPLQDFTPNKLLCLAATFKHVYGNRKDVQINIFSSYDASLRSILLQEYTEEDSKALAQLHAWYSFDAGTRKEYIDIMPVGAVPGAPLHPGAYSTRIDLSAAKSPHCRLEIKGRCLIALEEVSYPIEARPRNAAGTVTLSAVFSQGGEVGNIRVIKTAIMPGEDKDILTNAAVQNLSTWHLEPGRENDPIHITYAYVIDTSVRLEEVHWKLPNEVVIRRKPSH